MGQNLSKQHVKGKENQRRKKKNQQQAQQQDFNIFYVNLMTYEQNKMKKITFGTPKGRTTGYTVKEANPTCENCRWKLSFLQQNFFKGLVTP